MDVFRYFIAIPDNTSRRSIRYNTLESQYMMERPYAIDGRVLTYYPNVFALMVL